MKPTVTPQGSPAPSKLSSPKSGVAKRSVSHPMRPTVTPHGSPAPSTPESGAATKRPRKAAALSDVTNLFRGPDTGTPVKSRRPGRRPLQQHSAASPTTCSSSSSAALVTPAPKRPSAAVLEDECGVFKSPAISTVYARRGTTEAQGRGSAGAPATDKGKGKEPAATAAGTASCPQLGKSAGTRNSRKTSVAQHTRPISSSAPCHEAKKKRPSSSTPKFPEDFVKKQRAYFAEIDAFELPEEEVSEAELD